MLLFSTRGGVSNDGSGGFNRSFVCLPGGASTLPELTGASSLALSRRGVDPPGEKTDHSGRLRPARAFDCDTGRGTKPCGAPSVSPCGRTEARALRRPARTLSAATPSSVALISGVTVPRCDSSRSNSSANCRRDACVSWQKAVTAEGATCRLPNTRGKAYEGDMRVKRSSLDAKYRP